MDELSLNFIGPSPEWAWLILKHAPSALNPPMTIVVTSFLSCFFRPITFVGWPSHAATELNLPMTTVVTSLLSFRPIKIVVMSTSDQSRVFSSYSCHVRSHVRSKIF